MKLGYLSTLYVALLTTGQLAPAQGNFQNLGFESATLVPVPGQPPYYDFAQAFPSWTGFVRGVPDGLTGYNQLAMSIATFSILDSAYKPLGGYGSSGGLIQGNYSAVLMSGVSGPNQPSDATLTQTGLVPTLANSMQFKAQFAPFSSSGSWDVSLGGQALSLVPMSSGTNYTLYAADIHTFAGQTTELNFTVHSYPGQFAADYLFLDSIQFSPQSIPEPSVFGLSALGALLLGWRIVRGRR